MKSVGFIRHAAMTLLCAFAAITTWAQSTWSVSSSTAETTTTFTITRSGNTTTEETVFYRTIGLSAFEGVHFSAANGSLTFTSGQTSKTVDVTETAIADVDAHYRYQTGETRQYRFEVLDEGGFRQAYLDRTISSGSAYQIYTTDYNQQSLSVQSGEYTIHDTGFRQQYFSVPIDDFFTNTAPKDYFVASGAQLRMTVDLTAKEVDDGYQYIQILVNQTSNCDSPNGDSSDSNKPVTGNPGTPSYSNYMAGFEHAPSAQNTYWANYTFPVTSAADQATGVSSAWDNGSNVSNRLSSQYFKSGCRASDGRLIIANDLNTLGLRFAASGNGNDDWVVKNVVAKVQAVDASAPTALQTKVSSYGHRLLNTLYVSVAFNEIVTITSGATLSTSWGTLTYLAGSGTNVLTFSGSINAGARGSNLTINNLSTYISDLSGNHTATNVLAQTITTVTREDFEGSGSSGSPYLIASRADWIALAGLVNAGNNQSGTFFRQTADISVTTHVGYFNDDNSNAFKEFSGTYDGGGHTLTVTYNSSHMECAPFRFVDGVTIKNLHIAGTITTSAKDAAGLIGRLKTGSGITNIINCRSSVTINSSVSGDGTHGGFVAITRTNRDQTSTEGAARLNFTGCIFDGQLLGTKTNSCGGFVGWTETATGLYFTDCIFAPADVTVGTSNSATFARVRNSASFHSTNSFYQHSFGTAQGTSATPTSNKPANIGAQTAVYSVSGITAFANGLYTGGHYYCSSPQYNFTLTATPATILSESRYVTTFYHKTLNYQLPDGALAYTAGKVDGKVVFYRIGTDSNVIPAGTAVIIVANASTVNLTTLDSTTVSAKGGNILLGSDTDTTVPSGTAYVLGIAGEPGVLGFYPVTGNTIPAGKAFYVVN